MKLWRQEDWAETSEEMDREERDGKLLNADEETAAEAKAAREKAVYYLQFSGKTESELRKKLAEQGFSPASVDSAVAFVKKYRYIDDENYARRYVERSGKKKSRKQMMFELTQKGVARDILDIVFEDMEIDEESQIRAILEKKNYAGNGASREEKQKISAYLARKGFSYEAIMSAMALFSRS